VKPAQRRELVGWVQETYQLSERRACDAVGAARSSIRYRSRRPCQAPLRRRLRELATTRISYGYQRLCVLLRREGWVVNHKRVYRLYREEGLLLARRRPRRRKSVVARPSRPATTQADQRWAMDFVHDVLATTGKIRVLTLVDVHTRECLALVARPRFTGDDVAAVLTAVRAERGRLAPVIQVDNGAEFTSRALDHWAYWNQVRLDFSRPAKPVDNAVVEAFNGSLRRECLSQAWFASLAEAQHELERWRGEYNNDRPHKSLAQQPPAIFARGGYFTPSRSRLRS